MTLEELFWRTERRFRVFIRMRIPVARLIKWQSIGEDEVEPVARTVIIWAFISVKFQQKTAPSVVLRVPDVDTPKNWILLDSLLKRKNTLLLFISFQEAHIFFMKGVIYYCSVFCVHWRAVESIFCERCNILLLLILFWRTWPQSSPTDWL